MRSRRRCDHRLTGGGTLAGNQDGGKNRRPPQKLRPRRHGDRRWDPKRIELLSPEDELKEKSRFNHPQGARGRAQGDAALQHAAPPLM